MVEVIDPTLPVPLTVPPAKLDIADRAINLNDAFVDDGQVLIVGVGIVGEDQGARIDLEQVQPGGANAARERHRVPALTPKVLLTGRTMGPSQVLSPAMLRNEPCPLTPAPLVVSWWPVTVKPPGVGEPVASSSSVAPLPTRTSMPPVAATLAESPFHSGRWR